MPGVHNFQDSLDRSNSHSDAGWWEIAYSRAFPTMQSCVQVRSDGWAQRAGIDRVITLECGKVIKIDEKVREEDYGDILLEYWSDARRKKKGWVWKPLDCDFIAYAIAPAKTCYLLPTLILQRAFEMNKRTWLPLAMANKDGFRRVIAYNEGYETHSLAVPTSKLMESLTDAIVVSFEHDS